VNSCSDAHLHYGCLGCHAIKLVDECKHFGRTYFIIHIYVFFLKMEAASLSETIQVNLTVTLHPGRPDRDHFMMYEYYDWVGGSGGKM
jgi:hypothetical protein